MRRPGSVCEKWSWPGAPANITAATALLRGSSADACLADALLQREGERDRLRRGDRLALRRGDSDRLAERRGDATGSRSTGDLERPA